MPNFSNAKIYKITNDYNNDIYVGSTCDSLIKRFSAHKSLSLHNTNLERPLYKLINEIGFERFRIDLIEDFPCEDKYQLRQREGYHIRAIGTLNILIAGRVQKEYVKENRDKILAHHREKYQENREQELERQKEYRKQIFQKLKDYYSKNKEVLQQYKMEHYDKNKDKILTQAAQKIECECGCMIRKDGLTEHKKSKKHLEAIK